MTEETKQTEVASTETKVEQTKSPEVAGQPEKTIPVDVYGIQVELPLSKAKELITKRDTKTKEYNDLKGRITQAESQAKQEAERANLLQLMKASDADAVEAQVSAKYKDTISRFEKRVYNETIKSNLSKLGVISEGLEDATKLVMADAKVELNGDEVTINGIKSEEFLKEWTTKKPHLMAVQANAGKKLTTPAAPKVAGDFQKFTQTIFTKK